VQPSEYVNQGEMMDIRDIVEMIENSEEVKKETRRVITALQDKEKLPELRMSGLVVMMGLKGAGVPTEDILAMAFSIICKLRKSTGISEDEMMEIIKLYK
jgi:hypothetical protein